MIYFASPLFTSAERSWNSLLANNLRSHGEPVELPQEFCQGLDDPTEIADLCLTKLKECGIILVNCDGVDVDSGTSVEFGYAHAQGTKSIAYRTDFRRAGDCTKNCNLMIAAKADYFIYKPLAGYSEIGRSIIGILKNWENHDPKN